MFPLLGIAVWLLADVLVMRHVLYSFGGLELSGRIAITALWLFPVGFLMGMPFPKGAQRVGELVDWGFAVNGTASVLGSVLVLMLVWIAGDVRLGPLFLQRAPEPEIGPGSPDMSEPRRC